MTTPVVPGIPRAQRRQMMRAQGWRGSKAGRQFPNRSAHMGKTAEQLQAEADAANAAMAEHERRNALRNRGLIIPPSTEEAESLRTQGKISHDPRLILPGE